MAATDKDWDRNGDDLEDEEPEDDELDVELDDEDEEDDEDEDDEDDDDLEVLLQEEDIQRELAESRQWEGDSGRRVGPRPPSGSPDVSAGDVDADWGRADPVGDEAVGGTVSTPDQDIVDEIGEAAGLTYRDGEELDPTAKVDRRDVNKWERRLDPTTESDYAERQRELESGELDKKDPEKK